jgi:hypothetical protein
VVTFDYATCHNLKPFKMNHKTIGNTTLEELWIGRKPIGKNLQVFGCMLMLIDLVKQEQNWSLRT